MRKLFVPAFVGVAVLLSAASGPALEKTARVFTGDDLGGWNSSHTCSVAYYNICTGWIWIWSGFADGELLGTVFDSCCGTDNENILDGTYLYYWTGAVPGRGFTGTHSIYAVDENDCPSGAALASQAWLPASGWNLTLWSPTAVPDRFLVQASVRDRNGFGTPVALPSDGPQACGVCFPTTRATNSYRYGTETSPICPGSPLFDGDCQVEWLSRAMMLCTISTADENWGAIKNLYR